MTFRPTSAPTTFVSTAPLASMAAPTTRVVVLPASEALTAMTTSVSVA